MRQNLIQAEYMESDLTREKGLFWVDAGIMEREMYPSLRAGGLVDLPDAKSLVDTRALDAVYELFAQAA